MIWGGICRCPALGLVFTTVSTESNIKKATIFLRPSPQKKKKKNYYSLNFNNFFFTPHKTETRVVYSGVRRGRV